MIMYNKSKGLMESNNCLDKPKNKFLQEVNYGVW